MYIKKKSTISPIDNINYIKTETVNKRKFETYKAIDLFAGIGGIRLGFERAFNNQIKFVFSSEIDKYCRITYEKNFDEIPSGDITKIPSSKIPDFDILLAGFPCQAFSIAGLKKGFEDTRGTLFYEIVRILNDKRPISFFLENVANLLHHDNGKTFKIIQKVLSTDLNYTIHYKILNAKNFGLAQNRPRIYIIGFKKNYKFKFPKPSSEIPKLIDFLQDKIEEKYYISQKYLIALKNHKTRHRLKGHGFGYQILDMNGTANTLVSGGMGKERNLIQDKVLKDCYNGINDSPMKKNNKGIRNLTEREFANLQGFPTNFLIAVSMTQAYRQFANSVPIPVIKAIAEEIKKSLNERVLSKSLRQMTLNFY